MNRKQMVSGKATDAALAAVAASNAMQGLMKNAEAAAYLGIAPITLCIWRSTRRVAIPFVMVGKTPRYRRSDLDAYIASRTFDGTTSPPPEMKRKRPSGAGRQPKRKPGSVRNQKRRAA